MKERMKEGIEEGIKEGIKAGMGRQEGLPVRKTPAARKGAG